MVAASRSVLAATVVTVAGEEQASLLARAKNLRACASLFVRDAESDELDAEYRRLFGAGDSRPTSPLPLVPVCACNYLSGESGDSLDDVVAFYRLAGFDADRSPTRCPGHIATELEFLAHCLSLAAGGEIDAVRLARDFTVSHLFPWGAIFAAATASRARHPVTRLAAETLESLLFYELTEAGAVE